MRFRIRSDGTGRNTHVRLVDDDGQEHEVRGIQAVSWEIDEPTGRATATLKVMGVELESEIPNESPLTGFDESYVEVWMCPDCSERIDRPFPQPVWPPACRKHGKGEITDEVKMELVRFPIRKLPEGFGHMDTVLASVVGYAKKGLLRQIKEGNGASIGLSDCGSSEHNAELMLRWAARQADLDFEAGRLWLDGTRDLDRGSAAGYLRWHPEKDAGVGALDLQQGEAHG